MREQMNIVITGHVDHGKSTVIGRLLAETSSLPEGKIEAVKAYCARNSRPFEYAYLLDALKDEQAQGITIDTARCFFKTAARDYIIIDAPGHIEFLKNMVTGAARAEAAFLVIDAKEGIQENSKRHGYLISMLGIRQVSVLVNKMDLTDYSKDIFASIEKEYMSFLEKLGVSPLSFIPVSAQEGINITGASPKTPWYTGLCVLDQIDAFTKKPSDKHLPFRFPVQDIYKFTEYGDDRRIFAGTVACGTVKIGDEVLALPSGKKTRIKSVESFNEPTRNTSSAHEAVGFTVEPQIYIRKGELITKKDEALPCVSTAFRANIFWMGRAPMIVGKKYKLKIGTNQASVRLVNVITAIDATDLASNKNQDSIGRHGTAECILETTKPIAFDRISDIEYMGRFVIIDNYEIAGGGIIIDSFEEKETTLQKHISAREYNWERGDISPQERTTQYKHKSKFIVLTGREGVGKKAMAKALERRLFNESRKAYYLSMSTIIRGLDNDILSKEPDHEEYIRRLGELARILTDSGLIFITALSDVDNYDLDYLKQLNAPNEILVVQIGASPGQDYTADLTLQSSSDIEQAVESIRGFLQHKEIITDYCI